MQNIIAIVGALSLGIVIGWLVRFFLKRFKSFTPTVLGSVISLTFGGVAIKFLGGNNTTFWLYPIGVLVGFIVYTVIGVIAIRAENSDLQSSDEALKRKIAGGTRGHTLSKGKGGYGGVAYRNPPRENPQGKWKN